MVTGRQGAYGDMGKSWQEIGEIADLITSEDDSPGTRAAKVLVAMKLVRMKNSPENQDHYDDLAGYAEVLWRVFNVDVSDVQETSPVQGTPCPCRDATEHVVDRDEYVRTKCTECGGYNSYGPDCPCVSCVFLKAQA